MGPAQMSASVPAGQGLTWAGAARCTCSVHALGASGGVLSVPWVPVSVGVAVRCQRWSSDPHHFQYKQIIGLFSVFTRLLRKGQMFCSQSAGVGAMSRDLPPTYTFTPQEPSQMSPYPEYHGKLELVNSVYRCPTVLEWTTVSVGSGCLLRHKLLNPYP